MPRVAKLDPFSRCRSETTSRLCSSQNSAPEISALSITPAIGSSPPPCGEGLGVGVKLNEYASAVAPASTPSPTLPCKGEGVESASTTLLFHCLSDELIGGFRQQLIRCFAIN